MHHRSIAIAALAVAGLAACKGKDAASGDDLAKDLAMVSTPDGLTLAPAGAARTTVSAAEQLAPVHSHIAPSRASSPHRVRHRDRTSPEVAVTPVTATETPEAAVAAATPQPTAEPSRPTPVGPIPSGSGGSGGSGTGSAGTGSGSHGSGPGIGDVIGTVFGVVIRGGIGDDDHCDPRTDGRRRRDPIAINTRVPIPHGPF